MVFGKIGETSQHMLLLTPLILWVSKFQFALFFLNAKRRSIAWLSIFLNLHIFISVQQICHLVNAKRKVNIPIFLIWNSHGRSGLEVISVTSHTSFRVFTALGQFREMVKSPQIMGMNKEKSLYLYYASKLVSFKPRVLPVFGHLGI